MRKAQEIRLCRPYSVAWSIPLGKQRPGSKSCSPARHALTGVTLSRKIQCLHFTSYHHPSVSYCDFIDLVYSFWSAMGKSWTTPAEKTFLDAEFENYLSNQGEKKYGTRKRFLHGLYLRYFAQFPMPEIHESGLPLEKRMSDRRGVSPQPTHDFAFLTFDVANQAILGLGVTQNHQRGSSVAEVFKTPNNGNH